MAVDLRVYDNEHGDPVVVMVTTGTFDVSRLAGLMAQGRCEDGGRAKAISRALSRHNGGVSALKLLAAHGGPDLLERVTAKASPEQMLREFHAAAGLPLPAAPTARPELGSQTGRAKILAEEICELADAIEAGDIVEIADACADVVYAVVGTAVTYGVPFDAALAEVHRSNMTKLIPPVVVNGDGKIVKGPGYEPPDIARVLGLAGGSADA